MLDRKNFKEGGDYTYNGQDYEVSFLMAQGGFVEADGRRQEWTEDQGINASASHIDEADECR